MTPAQAPLTFAVEPFDKFALEEDLFQTHAELVGKTWDDVLRLNWPLAGSMAARGEVFFVVARSAGRAVGYAVVMLGSDLMAERVVASLVFLFALPEWPGLGVKLARAAAWASKLRGASALWLFATDDSASSRRLGTLAKRLGAEPISTTYEVSLP